ncbi:hypothetical protein D3C81_1729370 [compost metagenome]
MFKAGGAEVGVEDIQADFGRVAGAPLQGAGDAKAVLIVLQNAIARQTRGKGVDHALALTGSADVAALPAHGAMTFFQGLARGIGDREQGAELAVSPGVGDQEGPARVGVLGQIVVADLT